MAEITINPDAAEAEARLQDETETLSARFMDWVRTELVWYAGSFTLHLLALSVLLLLGPIMTHENQGDAPQFESKAIEEPGKDSDLEIDDTGKELPPLPLERIKVDPIPPLPLLPPQPEAENGQNGENGEDGKDDLPGGCMKTGAKDIVTGGAATIGFGNGPKPVGPQGIGSVFGTGDHPGNGGPGDGFKWRRGRAGDPGNPPTKSTERAVRAALAWLARHQNLSDGSWSLQNYTQHCDDKTCTGTGNVSADSGATAMCLLTFLATGDTHRTKGPYRDNISRGIAWLIRNQRPDGNLAAGAQQMMYSHGLATIALSEAYGLSGDKQVGIAAQRAVDFILNAQNKADGGWRYNPNDPGDTSVVGWQLMALKSAHMAGLNVGGSVFSGTSKWLDAVAVHEGSEYSYQPGQGPSPAMTSVGLLCRQYLGVKRDNPMLTGGTAYLLNHLPDDSFKNIYYWYYATQVMHNMPSTEWDTWNRKMRNILVASQVRDKTCAHGSWDPANDTWGRNGGRVMQTALSCLTLEVYYRYLPLFKTEASDEARGGADKPVKGRAKGGP